MEAYSATTSIDVLMILFTVLGPSLVIIKEIYDAYQSDAALKVKQVKLLLLLGCHLTGPDVHSPYLISMRLISIPSTIPGPIPRPC